MQALQMVQPQKTKVVVIHEKALLIAHDIKTKYLQFFEILMEVEAEQIYLQFEVPSLVMYCTELLELSPQIAKDFSAVVKKSFEVPSLATALRSQQISISKARKICPAITETDSKRWIELAAECSTRIVEKAVALANPKAAVIESLVYASEERLELRLGVSEEWSNYLKKTKDLLSQQLRRPVDTEEALLILMKEKCEKIDPVEKAKRAAKKRKNMAVEPAPKKNGRHIPASVTHAVNIRDQNQCTYVNANGKRCESRRWLHMHHIQHFAAGGLHSAENLQTLCSAHHKIKHLSENL